MSISRLKIFGKLAISVIILMMVSSCSTEPKSRSQVTPVPQNSLNLQQQKRIALVIGNANYQVGKLDTPLNDATDMANALKELGFEVILLKDSSKRQMDDALDQFTTRINQGYVGLFYYAGHGMEVEGENYLIPVNAQIKAEKDIQYESMPLGKILGRMEGAGNRINIVILDACRDNPFRKFWRSSSRGLTAPVQAASGTLIAFATAPGKVASDGTGRNGLFTSYLLKYIKTPNMEVDLMLRKVRSDVAQNTNNYQVPWTSSSLIGEFAFNQKTETTPPIVTSSPVPKPSPSIAALPQLFPPQLSPNPVVTPTPQPSSTQVSTTSSPSITRSLRTLKGSSDAIQILSFSSDGKRFFSTSFGNEWLSGRYTKENSIKIWNIAAGKLEHTLKGHYSTITSIHISSDNNRIISASDDRTIKIWNISTGKLERTLKGHSQQVSVAVISPDQRYIISGGQDKTMKIWNFKTGKLERTLMGHSGWIYSLALSPNGKHIVSADSEINGIKIWNLATGKLERTLLTANSSKTREGFAISSKGRYIVSASEDKNINVWDLDTGKLEHTIESGNSLSAPNVILSPDGQYIIGYNRWDEAKVWNLRTEKLERTLEGSSRGIQYVVISPDGQHIVGTGGDRGRTIRVWNVATGKLESTLEGHSNFVSSIAISPDGQYIASGSSDGEIRMWRWK